MIESLKKINWPYAVYRELVRLKTDRRSLWAEAVHQNEENPPDHFSLSDYKKAMYKQRVSFKEYNTYKFWQLNEDERMNYLSENELKCIYRKLENVNVSKWFDNKLLTHIKFKKYMQRDWICPSISSFDTFSQFLLSKDCIVKPLKGSLGKGVFVLKKDKIENLRDIYDYCIKNGLFVEECVKGCKELEEFHPQSLNTIRVITMSKGEKFRVLSCLLRLGVGGNVVDNAAVGGILAPIDPITGALMDHGKDKVGNTYTKHPDTLKDIKGFVVPQWDNVMAACKEMMSFVPDKVFAGWDLCVLENGEVELIEVNSGPNIMGSQITHGCGFGPKIQNIGNDLLGFDLKRLISVWSIPYSNYSDYMRYKKHSRNFNLLIKDYVDCLAMDHEKTSK